MKMHPKLATHRQRGISLFEALITIVILAFGILGLANLQARMQQAEVESYARSQALVLLDDMAARLEASADRSDAAALAGSVATYLTATSANPAGTGDSQPSDCSGTAIGPARDLCEWSNALKGSAELDANTIAVGAMMGGRGCIEDLGGVPPSYRVAVAWQGLSPTVAPSIGCAQGSYGNNDAYRRVVSKVVTIPDLTP